MSISKLIKLMLFIIIICFNIKISVSGLVSKNDNYDSIKKRQVEIEISTRATSANIFNHHVNNQNLAFNSFNTFNQTLEFLSDFNNDLNISVFSNNFNISNATHDPNFSIVRNILLSFVFIPIILSTLIGNMLVILAVVIVRKLHTQDNANNYLIVSLAVSDFLVGVLAMPFAVYVEFSEDNKWYLGAILCDLWTLSDVLLCTASILNLCAISVDRYFIILHAMVYTQRRNAKLMLLMILVVWLLSALISIPPLFGWGKPSARLHEHQICAVSSDLKYQIYATLGAFYLPLIVMIIIYINIFRAANKIKKREMETAGRLQFSIPLGTYTTSDYIPQTEPLLNETNTKSNKNLDVVATLKSSESENASIESKLYHSSVSSQEIGNNVNNEHRLSTPSQTQGILSSTAMNHHHSGSHVILNAIGNSPGNLKRFGRRLTLALGGIKRNSSQSASGKNQKATRTLGVIMGCFTLCWLPFFILALVKGISVGGDRVIGDYVPKWLDSLLLWLGYFNSALNPMIYARFNREFRRPFIEILCFRCRGINDKLRDEERRKMYNNNNNLMSSSANPIAKGKKKKSASLATAYIQTNITNSTIYVNKSEAPKEVSESSEHLLGNNAEHRVSEFKVKLTETSELTELEANKPESSRIAQMSIKENDAGDNLDTESFKIRLKKEKNKFFYGSEQTPTQSNAQLQNLDTPSQTNDQIALVEEKKETDIRENASPKSTKAFFLKRNSQASHSGSSVASLDENNNKISTTQIQDIHETPKDNESSAQTPTSNYSTPELISPATPKLDNEQSNINQNGLESANSSMSTIDSAVFESQANTSQTKVEKVEKEEEEVSIGSKFKDSESSIPFSSNYSFKTAPTSPVVEVNCENLVQKAQQTETTKEPCSIGHAVKSNSTHKSETSRLRKLLNYSTRRYQTINSDTVQVSPRAAKKLKSKAKISSSTSSSSIPLAYCTYNRRSSRSASPFNKKIIITSANVPLTPVLNTNGCRNGDVNDMNSQDLPLHMSSLSTIVSEQDQYSNNNSECARTNGNTNLCMKKLVTSTENRSSSPT